MFRVDDVGVWMCCWRLFLDGGILIGGQIDDWLGGEDSEEAQFPLVVLHIWML